MVNLTDVLIIAISFLSLLGAVLLLRTQVDQRDAYRIRKLRSKAENDQKIIADVLNTLQNGSADAEYLTNQLKSRVEQINKESQETRTRAEVADRAIETAREAETELRAISSQLSDRIQFVQNYWEEQLGDTADTVKQLKTRLDVGLTQLDEGIVRVREQEKMAQGFTQKLLTHHQQQLNEQETNKRLSTQIRTELDKILSESKTSIQTLKTQHEEASAFFQKFTTDMTALEQQAQEQFAEIFQSTDVARQEMNNGLKDARSYIEKLKDCETQSQNMNHRIKEQFDLVNGLKFDRLSQTVNLTDEMCVNLQDGLENAKALLATLEAKTKELVQASDEEPEPGKIDSVSGDGKPRNLFSLRAIR